MKKTNITLSIALAAVFSASTAFAEAEVTGKIVHESAKFTTSGTTIGAATAHGKDTFKQETSARIYIDGEANEVSDGSTYHIELNLMSDSKGIGKYDGNESYTQRDALREAYVDTTMDDWSIRAGKQQVVWGTADGMKLLDMINPSDYGEMAQNQMEDSRIPVWMVNAETTNEDGSEFQVVVSEPRENVFAGLNRSIPTAKRVNSQVTSLTVSPDIVGVGHDQGNAFIMKGVDSITGQTNGFLNIVPDLGSVATMFGMAFNDTGLNAAGLNPATHGAMNFFTVGSFNSATSLKNFSASYNGMVASGSTHMTALAFGGVAATQTGGKLGFEDLVFGTTAFWTTASSGATVAATSTDAGTLYDGQGALAGFAAMFPKSNLLAVDSGTNSTFEYMDRTPFSTFDAFVGAKSQYKYNMPSASDADLALKYKKTTEDGVSYSMNYSNSYDKNPIINLSWKDDSGNTLQTCRNTIAGTTARNVFLSLEATGAACSGASVVGGEASRAAGVSPETTKAGTLEFEQTVKRIHNIGGSFDMAIETEALGPVVIRGEGLYQKDVYTPVMDKGALSIGDLPAALTMRKGDRFKYVLGADVTAFTNMMVSAQFIQDRNLDYIDSSVDWDGTTSCATASDVSSNCGVYTTDYATMHMTNGFNKAEKDKNFYSLFLSKPFGASGEHRWNNIFMYEKNGGKWNRLDAEFSIDDDTQVTTEYNKYWGNENTQFGQLEAASNMQIGVKYSF
jgi:hypothetical protein